MRDETVARSYAETLFELARRHDAIQPYGEALSTVVELIESDPKFRIFLETPRITDVDRKALVQKVFGGKLPKHVVNFVLVVIDKRRQRLLRAIGRQYAALLDEFLGREHVDVTLARPVDEPTRQLIAGSLSSLLGKQAIPHFSVKPEIIGGLVVRTGNTIYDGSIKRRLEGMRRRLLRADLPHEALGEAGA